MAQTGDLDRATEVPLQEWERRKEFVGFTAEDARLLSELRPVAEAYADEEVEELYRRILRSEEAHAFFPDDATLHHVKTLQKEYFLGLTRGDYGKEYLANRLHIGRVHQRIGLSPRWYIGGYSIYLQLIFPRVMAAFAADEDKAQRMFTALLKLILLDQDLAITTYITAGEEELAETQKGLLALTLELEQRVEARTVELRTARDELAQANAQLRRLTAELEDRVARRTAELLAKTQEVEAVSQQLWHAAKLATMGELAASIAHELNNPLATVSLRVELLLAQVPADDPKAQELEIIAQETERMGNLVANLLQFSRHGHPQMSSLKVREEIERTLELIYYHLRNRRIAVVQEFAANIPQVHADRQQLRQLFLNLFTNASDAMPQGGTLTIRVSVEAQKAEEEREQAAVVIEVADTGVGIAPEDLPKVMEPFFTTKAEGEGTGLGLAICRRTVQQHGGTLALESERGKGTTVRITLPAVNATVS